VTLPEIDLVDLKDNPPEKGDFISAPLIEATKAVLARGDQAMLYLNRRGYAPLRAVCHQTGFSMRMPTACPECKSEDSLTPVGPGVERVAEEAERHFPDAKIERPPRR